MFKILIIAGEASGDELGSSLIHGIKKTMDQIVDFQGIGGPLMIENGLKCLYEMKEISVMGFIEIIPKVPKILKIIRSLEEYVQAWKPDLIVTIDSPDFCLRVAKRVKNKNPSISIVHYVAPSVWAWREGRTKKMSKYVDHVLALLPFEPSYLKKVGLSCDFVGHPVVSRKIPNQKEISLFRNSFNLTENSLIITLLPGSRKSEIKKMKPIYTKFIRRVLINFPNIKFILPSTIGVHDQVVDWLKKEKLPVIHISEKNNQASNFKEQKKIIFSASVLAVATSGTVSIELAHVGTPMIIGYKTSFITTLLIKKLVKIKSATLINILTNKNAIPEFLFENCKSDNLYNSMVEILSSKEKINSQLKVSREAIEMLGYGKFDPGTKAAESILNFIKLK